MPMNLAIKLPDLRRITDLIFDHIEQDLKISAVPIEEDNYWNVPTEELYDVLKEPAKLDIGQLYDDWEFLTKIQTKEEAVALMMIHLAPILRYIAEKIGQ